MALKIAISGKGGTGKTTVAAILASLYARDGCRVLAVDADPASSLPAALGVPEEVRKRIVPLSQMLDIIEERTGARPGESYGNLFSLNPRVDDLVRRYAIRGGDCIDVLVLGTIKAPGSGCFCPESSLLKGLLRHLVMEDGSLLILDMEAGLEHLGRSTLRSVDVMVVVIEPGQRSVETGVRIASMAKDMGVREVCAILNKVSSSHHRDELHRQLETAGLPYKGVIPLDLRLVEADLAGLRPIDCGAEQVFQEIARLREHIDKIT